MPIRVQLPNGKIAEFPDGMSHEEIRAAIMQLDPLERAPEDSDATQALNAAGRTVGGLIQFGGALADAANPDRAAPLVAGMSDEDYANVGRDVLPTAKNLVNRGAEMGVGLMGAVGRGAAWIGKQLPDSGVGSTVGNVLEAGGNLVSGLSTRVSSEGRVAVAKDRQARGLPSLEELDSRDPMNRLGAGLTEVGQEVALSHTGLETQANQESLSRAFDAGIWPLVKHVATNKIAMIDAVGPSMAEYMIPGGAAGRLARVGLMERAVVSGERAAARVAAEGGDALAQAMAKSEAMIAGAKGASEAAGSVAAVTQAGQSAIMQGQQASQEVMALPLDQLRQFPGFDQLEAEVGADAAREIAARMAGDATAAGTGLINLVTYAGAQRLGLNPFESKIAGGQSVSGAAGQMTGLTGRAARAGVHGAQEATGEFVQGAGEQMGQNLGMGAADARVEAGDDVLKAGLMEAMVGAPMGGLTGALEAPRAPAATQPQAQASGAPQAPAAPAPGMPAPGQATPPVAAGISAADQMLADAAAAAPPVAVPSADDARLSQLLAPLEPESTGPAPDVPRETSAAPTPAAAPAGTVAAQGPERAGAAESGQSSTTEQATPGARDITAADRAAAPPLATAYGRDLSPPSKVDEEWIKANVDTLPEPTAEELPTDSAWRYFKQANADAVLPAAALDGAGAAASPVAMRRMAAAAAGKIPGRDAVDVRDNGDGTFSVLGGADAVAAAKAIGLSEIPVRIVEAPQGAEGWRRSRGQLSPEADAALTETYERAAAAKPGYDSRIRSLAKRYGGNAKLVGIKGRTRAEEKVAADYGGDVSRLKDLVRATIVFDTPAQVRAAVKEVSSAFKVLEVKDAVSEGTPDKGFGYRDVGIVYELPNGTKAELQLMTSAMADAKSKGHDLYSQWRTLDVERRAAESRGEAFAPDKLERMQELADAQAALYGPAWDSQPAPRSEAIAEAAASRETRTYEPPGAQSRATSDESTNGAPSSDRSVTSRPPETNTANPGLNAASSARSKNSAESGMGLPSQTSSSSPAMETSSAGEQSPGEGSVARPSVSANTVAEASAQAATSPDNDLPEPTQAQKEAGNYAKGKLRIDGVDVSIENPAGSRRRPEWPPLAHAYGYIRGTEGADGDHVDVFLSEDAGQTATERPVFVVDQRNRNGTFDEHKVLIGFPDEAAARAGYLANYSRGWNGLGAITRMSWPEFKAWARDPANTRKPAAGGDVDPLAAAVARTLKAQGAEGAGTRVKIVDSVDDLPPGLRSQVDGDTDGLFDPNKGVVYLIRSALPTEPQAQAQRAAWVVWHELAGHFGLRRAFPGRALADALAAAASNPTVSALADAIAADRGLTPGQAIGRELAVEEALSELAAALRTGDLQALADTWGVTIEPEPAGVAALIARVLKAIKASIVKAFGGTMPYSDQQVRELLEHAMAQVRQDRGASGTDGDAAQSRAGVLPFSRMEDAPVGAVVQGPRIPGVPDSDQTQTPAFKRWFGNSVVTEDGKPGGKPRVMYHGSRASFDEFRPSNKPFDLGIHVGTIAQAHDNKFLGGEGAQVYPVYVRIENPLRMRDVFGRNDSDDLYWMMYELNEEPGPMQGKISEEDMRAMLKAPPSEFGRLVQSIIEKAGYDGIVYKNKGEPEVWNHRDVSKNVYADSYIAFRPQQIKSATANRGTFDLGKKNILQSRRRPRALDEVAERFRSETGDDPERALTRLAGIAMRNGAREAGSLEGDPESSPYTEEQMGLLDQYRDMKNPSSRHLFHTTTPDRIESIKANGLQPNSKQRFEGVSNGRLSLSANEAVARYYGSDTDVMLRLRRDYDLGDLEADLLGGGDGAYTTGNAIPPEALEVKVGRKWVPLPDYDPAPAPQSRAEPDDATAFFARTTKGVLRDTGHAAAINDDGTVTLYHGTSAKNARGIERDGKFRGFPFFTPDKAVAKRYSQQVGTGTKEVMTLRVDPGSLVPTGGYLSARMEGLARDEDGAWRLPVAQSRAPDQTDTPAFRRWFGDSKVVDADGKPLVVYHSSPENIEQFDSTRTVDGGFHFGEESQARMRGRRGNTMVGAYLSIVKPRRSKDMGGNWRAKIASAKSAGHDGIVYLNRYEGIPLERLEALRERGITSERLDRMTDAEFRRSVPEAMDSWIAFKPEQIKSATANSGAFDPSNPSILQSRRTRAEALKERGQKIGALAGAGYPVATFNQSGKTWDATIRKGKDKLFHEMRRVLQDRMIGVREAQRDIEEAIGGPLAEAANLYRAENLMHGKAADGVRRVRDNLVDPLKAAIKASGLEVKEIERFLLAQHALERNARIAKINPGMPDGGSSLFNADAHAIISAAMSGPKAAELQKISQLVQQVRLHTLNTLRNSGQISTQQFQALRGMYKHYVPLRGREGEEGEQRIGSGRGIDMRGKPVQRALGRRTQPANILGELVGDAERAQVLAAKAEVGRVLLRAALEYPNPDFWQVERVTTEPKFSEATGEVYEAVVNDTTDEETVIVKHDGKPYRVRLVDPELRAAMKNLGVEGFEGVARYLGWVNRWLSAVFTRFNPAFVPVNMLRDMIQGGIGVASELGAKAVGQVAALYPKAAAGLYAEARGQGDASVPDAQKSMADWAREFMESGGTTGYQVFADPARLQEQIEFEMAGLLDIVKRGKPLAAVAEGLRRTKTMQTIETANEIIENSMRLAVYVHRRQAGKSAAQAAEYAKNLTVNFNRKGTGAAVGNALFLFFNASMQGTHRTLKLLRDPKVLAGLSALGATQFALAITMGAARFEDEDETLWEQIPDHVRQKAFVIPLGFDETGGPQYVAIPMPFGFNLFSYVGGYPALLASPTWRSRHDPVRTTMGDIARAGVDAFSVVPVGDEGWYFPTVMRIFANLQANRDDLGRRIREDGGFAKFEGPRASQGKADTPEMYKDIARLLNRVGGGDDYTKPVSNLLDFAPEDIEYLAGTFTGGPGTALQQLWRSGERAGAGLPLRPDDIPVTRRIVGSQSKAQVDSTAYYNSAEVMERGLQRLKDAFAEGGEDAFYALREELGPQFDGVELGRYKTANFAKGYTFGQVKTSEGGQPTLEAVPGSTYRAYKDAAKAVTGYGKEIRRLYGEDMDRIERRREIDAMQQERAWAMRDFLNAWNEGAR